MRLNITISDEMNNNLQVVCSRWGCSKSDLIAIIVGQYMDGFDSKTFRDSFDRISRLKQLELMEQK